MRSFTFSAQAKKFGGSLAWTYVPVPRTHTDGMRAPRRKNMGWGFLPARITVGATTWDSSLLPLGDGTYFVALKASLRKKEHITAGDTVQVEVTFLF